MWRHNLNAVQTIKSIYLKPCRTNRVSYKWYAHTRLYNPKWYLCFIHTCIYIHFQTFWIYNVQVSTLTMTYQPVSTHYCSLYDFCIIVKHTHTVDLLELKPDIRMHIL